MTTNIIVEILNPFDLFSTRYVNDAVRQMPVVDFSYFKGVSTSSSMYSNRKKNILKILLVSKTFKLCNYIFFKPLSFIHKEHMYT